MVEVFGEHLLPLPGTDIYARLLSALCQAVTDTSQTHSLELAENSRSQTPSSLQQQAACPPDAKIPIKIQGKIKQCALKSGKTLS